MIAAVRPRSTGHKIARLIAGVVIGALLCAVGIHMIVEGRWPTFLSALNHYGSARGSVRWLGAAFVSAAQVAGLTLAAWTIYPARRGDQLYFLLMIGLMTLTAFAALVLWAAE